MEKREREEEEKKDDTSNGQTCISVCSIAQASASDEIPKKNVANYNRKNHVSSRM